MKPHIKFREDKTTQVGAILLKVRGGRMSYMKLIKLLYLIDRQSLIDWGRPVTFDTYVSMPHGPVLRKTLDLINEGIHPGHKTYWHSFISAPEKYEVKLKKVPPPDELSDAEIRLSHEIFKEYGHMTRWELSDYAHNLPEYKNPQGSALAIFYQDILVKGARKTWHFYGHYTSTLEFQLAYVCSLEEKIKVSPPQIDGRVLPVSGFA